MKTKLTISIMLGLLTLAFVYDPVGLLFNNAPGSSVESNNTNQQYKLSAEEKQKRIEYLLSGKSEKYESENDFRGSETGTVIKDTSEFGNGGYVIHCDASVDEPGYILKGVKKRTYEYSIKNVWMNDTAHNWYIIPRIRIKQDLIHPFVYEKFLNDAHLKVCRLEVVNTEGKVISETEYEVKHFCEKYEGDECMIYYSGNYIEGYGYLFDDVRGRKSYTVINGKDLNPQGLSNKEKTTLDYRIYWYGIADIWIDYIRVENDLAMELPEGKCDNLISSIKNIDIKGINDIKVNADQLLYFNNLKNRAYGIGIRVN